MYITHTHTAVNVASLKKNKAYSHILDALKKHPADVNVLSGGLLALSYILRVDHYAASNVLLCGDHAILQDFVTTHPSNPLIVAYGCRALQALTTSEEGGEELRESGTLQLAVGVLDRFEGEVAVVSAACGLIDGLTAESEGGKRGEGGGDRGEGGRGER